MMRGISILTLAALAAIGLPGSATAQSRGSGAAAGSNDPNRLICRRMSETGSLAATRRQCFTRAEWDRIAESQQAGAQRVIDDSLVRQPGGN
jgi:hypothetical protein